MLWYPYAQMKTVEPPIKIVSAQGVHLYTEDGHDLIDSISSWWSVIHGYNNGRINNVIKEQLDKFAHVMLGGISHEPVRKLSEKLASWLPGDLNYCFFSDSGSVAVEVALKMALQFNTNRGSDRSVILALRHAYHGDTFKAMEVGDDEDYHFAFGGCGGKKRGVIH
ncbi:MAG: aminotransferase class III-fold pyridoxal phosphate-dependent enzyme, partial [Thermoguttaceae bacterium]|nr:aminotransferase class III-fold pyridoxal phosphate-dependent enzyme [Thermoguttaceae bacterium]